MYRVIHHARRERTTASILSKPYDMSRLLAAVIVTVLSVAAATGSAVAQVANTDTFTPVSWRQATTVTTTVTRPAHRTTSTSTDLEDFSIPGRTVRRSTKSRAPRAITRFVERRSRPAPRRTRVASLGRIGLPSVSAPRPSLSGGGIAWRASSGCLAGNLRSIVSSAAANYGSLTVNSTCRSRTHNRRVGGASRSWHLTGNAVDFRVHGANIGRLSAYLRSNVGGFKHYGGGRYHIDNGPKRSF